MIELLAASVIGIFVFSFLAGVSEGLGGTGCLFGGLSIVSLIVAMICAVSILFT